MANRIQSVQKNVADRPKGHSVSLSGSVSCAIYARCACSKGSRASIRNQIRECVRYAEKQHWTIAKDCVVADIGASGMSFSGRTALRTLMSAAKKRSLSFDHLLISDIRRLTRNIRDYALISKHFSDSNVHM